MEQIMFWKFYLDNNETITDNLHDDCPAWEISFRHRIDEWPLISAKMKMILVAEVHQNERLKK